MAFLRFSSDACTVEVKSEASKHLEKQILTLSFERVPLAELSLVLGEIQAKEGSELRAEFPSGWTIFWKIREGESRFFVARPEVGEWVATLALSRSHLDAIRAQMNSGTAGSLSAHERISRMSNIDVILTMQGPQ